MRNKQVHFSRDSSQHKHILPTRPEVSSGLTEMRLCQLRALRDSQRPRLGRFSTVLTIPYLSPTEQLQTVTPNTYNNTFFSIYNIFFTFLTIIRAKAKNYQRTLHPGFKCSHSIHVNTFVSRAEVGKTAPSKEGSHVKQTHKPLNSKGLRLEPFHQARDWDKSQREFQQDSGKAGC